MFLPYRVPAYQGIEGKKGLCDDYGAIIAVHAGGKKWVHWLNPGQSFLCSNDPRARRLLETVQKRANP
jgi:hypothetical protein